MSESKDKDFEAQLASIDADIKQIDNAIERLSTKKQKLLSKKQQIKQKIQEYASEKLANQDWERSDHPWSEKVFETLKSVFRMSKFRPHQLSTINAVMSQQDCILLMPTGGGKSLCYQLPALVLPGITLVVSPLVSLMEDQIMAMEALNVPAVLLNASSSREHVNNVHKQMTEKNPSIKIIYVTPEKLAKSKRFMAKLEKMYKMGQFSLLAIDEVHCCSQWGHDFRTDYKFLGIMKRQFPKVPILGLTATATSSVIADVQNILNIQGCLVLRASFNRPNLKYEVVCKSSCQKDNIDELENLLKNRFNGLTGIIYCFSIKDSEEIAAELRKRSVKARAYHAQLDAKSRSSVHQSWSTSNIQVIVATVAFGMGIDKPDVRFVIHHSMPKSMENFYQESGRAGRDDNPASCILFYRFPDLFRQSTMVFTEQKGLEHLYAMVSYCLDISRCRRAIIAEHFGERWNSSDCNSMCDHCDKFNPYDFGLISKLICTVFPTSLYERLTNEICDLLNVTIREINVEKIKNVAKEYKTLRHILEHCNMIDERLTSQKLIDIWQGKGSPKCRPPDYQSTSLSRETCERIVALLLIDTYLIEEFHFTPYSTISYINIGPRNLPASGELLLPLPILKAKVESKNTNSQDHKSVNNEKQSSISDEKKRKLSPISDSPNKSSKPSCSKDLSSNKTKTSSNKIKQSVNNALENKPSPAKIELCVVNKKKSHFNNKELINVDDEPVKNNKETPLEVKKESPEQIDLSDNELDFDDYEEINYRKKRKSVQMIVVSDSE